MSPMLYKESMKAKTPSAKRTVHQINIIHSVDINPFPQWAVKFYGCAFSSNAFTYAKFFVVAKGRLLELSD